MKKQIWTILLAISFTINSYSQTLTDSTIAMIAFWELGDEVVYKFKEEEEKVSKGEKTLVKTTYDAVMTIMDSTETNYRVQWKYNNHKTDRDLSLIDKDLLAICLNIPIQYRTDELGAFETIDNWADMKNIANQIFEQLIADRQQLPDSVKIGIQKMLAGMFETEAQMNYWARDLHFFHYLYGANLYRNMPVEVEKLYTNPFIEMTMPGHQRIEVLTVDEINEVAHIRVTAGIEGDKAKELMVDFVRKNMANFGFTDASEIKKDDFPNYAVTEEYHFIYHIETGYILKGSYSKVAKLEEDYKQTTYEYELVY